jgi:hypothetical protein
MGHLLLATFAISVPEVWALMNCRRLLALRSARGHANQAHNRVRRTGINFRAKCLDKSCLLIRLYKGGVGGLPMRESPFMARWALAVARPVMAENLSAERSARTTFPQIHAHAAAMGCDVVDKTNKRLSERIDNLELTAGRHRFSQQHGSAYADTHRRPELPYPYSSNIRFAVDSAYFASRLFST